MLRVTLATRLALIVIVAFSAISHHRHRGVLSNVGRGKTNWRALRRAGWRPLRTLIERSDPRMRARCLLDGRLVAAIRGPRRGRRRCEFLPPRVLRNQQARLDEIYSGRAPRARGHGSADAARPTTDGFRGWRGPTSNAVEFRIAIAHRRDADRGRPTASR